MLQEVQKGPEAAQAEAQAQNPAAFGPLEERLARETVTRPERVAALSAQVDRLFPGEALAELRDEIKATFNVPQFGKYHNEGMYMDTHLALILRTLRDVRDGIVDPRVPPDVAEWMQVAVRAHGDDFIKYTMLHDLDKPSCSMITFNDETQKEIGAAELYALIPAQKAHDCAAAYAALHELNIAKISYHHASTERKHGPVAAERLASVREEIGVPQTLLKAIELHEIAYQFDSGKAGNFRKHFNGLTADQQVWVLTASYIDLMGSLTADGTSDLSPFVCLTTAMKNDQILSFLETQRGEGGRLASRIDAAKFSRHFDALKRSETLIADSPEAALESARKICGLTVYDRAKLGAGLAGLATGGIISAEVVVDIMSCLEIGEQAAFDLAQFAAVRGKLGRANAQIAEVMRGAEV